MEKKKLVTFASPPASSNHSSSNSEGSALLCRTCGSRRRGRLVGAFVLCLLLLVLSGWLCLPPHRPLAKRLGFHLCRDFPNARAVRGGDKEEGRRCERSEGAPSDMVCSFEMTTLAVVVPFSPEEVETLLRGVLLWGHAEFFPCSRAEDYCKHADLVFHFSLPFSEHPAVVSRLQTALDLAGVTPYFREVRFLSSRVPAAPSSLLSSVAWRTSVRDAGEEARLREQERSGGGSRNGALLLSLMDREEDMATRYSHFFLMEPGVRPVRAGWVVQLLHEVVLEPVDFWVKGSLSYRISQESTGSLDDVTINSNALYKLGDSAFNCFLQNELKARNSHTCDVNIIQAAAEGRNRDTLHRFLRSTFIMSVDWNWYLRGFVHDHPDTFLVHGKAACSLIDKQYLGFLAKHHHLLSTHSGKTLELKDQAPIDVL